MNTRLSDDQIRTLIAEAEAARGNAYAPYSGYLVGAALLLEDGSIVRGCNIENASYGATNCAERTALFTAVGQGKRGFRAICIVAGKEDEDYPRGEAYQGDPARLDYPTPCGICRQALREFTDPAAFEVVLAKTAEDFHILTLDQLLPLSFGPASL